MAALNNLNRFISSGPPPPQPPPHHHQPQYLQAPAASHLHSPHLPSPHLPSPHLAAPYHFYPSQAPAFVPLVSPVQQMQRQALLLSHLRAHQQAQQTEQGTANNYNAQSSGFTPTPERKKFSFSIESIIGISSSGGEPSPASPRQTWSTSGRSARGRTTNYYFPSRSYRRLLQTELLSLRCAPTPSTYCICSTSSLHTCSCCCCQLPPPPPPRHAATRFHR